MIVAGLAAAAPEFPSSSVLLARGREEEGLGSSVTLKNGIEMPTQSLSTWQLDGTTAKQMVKTALDDVGMRHIDTAITYGNHVQIGEALAGRNRSSFFLTTKIDPKAGVTSKKGAYMGAKADLATCLTELDLDYVDLMLIHYPAASCDAVQGMWKAAEEFYAAGKARAIGVSNYCPDTLECMEDMQHVAPALNQVQYHVGMGADPGHPYGHVPVDGHPYPDTHAMSTPGIAKYCAERGIVLQAYSPLGDDESALISSDLVANIGAAHSKTGAQVAQRWIVQNNVALTTAKTTSRAQLEASGDIFDWSLTEEEMAQLSASTAPGASYSFACPFYPGIEMTSPPSPPPYPHDTEPQPPLPPQPLRSPWPPSPPGIPPLSSANDWSSWIAANPKAYDDGYYGPDHGSPQAYLDHVVRR